MQYAGAEGLIVWLVIVVISIVFRAVKASGGNVAMPPRRNNTPHSPRQTPIRQGNMPRPMQGMPRSTATVPPPMQVSGSQPQVPPQELERVRQELQSEFERVFAQVPRETGVSAPQPVASSAPRQTEQAARQRRQADSHVEHQKLHGGRGEKKPENVRFVPSTPIGVFAEASLQRRRRLREAYLLTELIGRPRAYDI